MSNKKKLLIGGIATGLLAVILALSGNPKNMAICVACFIRDMAGATKFHSAKVVQYFRPEIVGIILGSFIISLFTKEYKSTAGSSPAIRFFLGIIMVIGSLVFLGCPTRMVLRMSSGDISAWIGLIGFILGVLTGSIFLKKGFSLGRSYETRKESGFVLPVMLVILFIVSIATTWFVVSTKGPGSMHAPVIISILCGLAFGAIAQRIRMCFAGAVRDVFLLQSFDLLIMVGSFFVVMLVFNLVNGSFKFVDAGPVAHTDTLFNILGLYIVGFASVLLGGCPFRQLVLAGQGSNDSALTVFGMFVGAAIAHNWALAGVAKDATKNIIGGATSAGKIAVYFCIICLFVIAIIGTMKNKKNNK